MKGNLDCRRLTCGELDNLQFCRSVVDSLMLKKAISSSCRTESRSRDVVDVAVAEEQKFRQNDKFRVQLRVSLHNNTSCAISPLFSARQFVVFVLTYTIFEFPSLCLNLFLSWICFYEFKGR